MTAEREPLPTAPGPGTLEAATPRPETSESQPQDRPVGDRDIECSVGVMAYNEEANIAHALESILGQKLTGKRITEIVVVASGCRDRTAAIVADIATREGRVRLIEQPRREGKASAINLFITAARSPVLAMVSADVVVEDGAFDVLLEHFTDPHVGMAGGHPTPVNGTGTFLGHAVHLQWRLHDRIARECPKLGEVVAFRNVVPSIPLDTAVDELSMQALITQLGYRLVYEPRAVVYNRGPATIPDFMRQRRRIYSGHLRIREQQAYSAPTMSAWRAGRALLRSDPCTTPRTALWTAGTVGLEATARVLGWYDTMRRRHSHAVWEISDTTKGQIAEAANAQRQQNVAVFHIVNFHRVQLEIGLGASRQLIRRVADGIRRALGPAATVSIQQSGTFVVLLPGDRDEAERAACDVVQQFADAPVSHHGRGAAAQVTLACGIIAFPQGGPPLSRSIPISRLDVDSVPRLDVDPAPTAVR
jgi:poly-beta-1,6-N-acetyl-D-glucosamine synthase